MNWSELLTLTDYAPLADPTSPGVIVEASNLIPTDRGWRSAYGLADAGMESLTATCMGAALVQRADGTFLMFAGTTSRLWLRSANAWTQVCTDSYVATSDQRWRFCALGDYVLAANASDTVAVSNAGATFSPITSAPKATLIESVNGFVMAANVQHATYSGTDRWWCSAYANHADWTPALETQCTTGRLVDTPGPIRALKRLGRNVVAYKDGSMYLGEYVQPPTVWQWTLISSNIGTASHDAVVNIGQAHLFCGNGNFYAYDGAQVLPIGERIREWFFDQQLLRSYDGRVQAAHDAGKALVYWFYPPATGDGSLTQAVVYNYRANRWGVASYTIQAAADFVATSPTYDSLNTYWSGTYDDGIDRTYDSPLWVPDVVVPVVVSSAKKLATIDGASASSSFTTGHAGDDQQFSLLRRLRVRWLTLPTSATLDLYTADQHGDSMALTVSGVPLYESRFDLLASARWHQAKVTMTGNAEFSGLRVDVQPEGAW